MGVVIENMRRKETWEIAVLESSNMNLLGKCNSSLAMFKGEIVLATVKHRSRCICPEYADKGGTTQWKR